MWAMESALTEGLLVADCDVSEMLQRDYVNTDECYLNFDSGIPEITLDACVANNNKGSTILDGFEEICTDPVFINGDSCKVHLVYELSNVNLAYKCFSAQCVSTTCDSSSVIEFEDEFATSIYERMKEDIYNVRLELECTNGVYSINGRDDIEDVFTTNNGTTSIPDFGGFFRGLSNAKYDGGVKRKMEGDEDSNVLTIEEALESGEIEHELEVAKEVLSHPAGHRL